MKKNKNQNNQKVSSRKDVPTILFLSTALINHIPDKLLYRQVIWNLDERVISKACEVWFVNLFLIERTEYSWLAKVISLGKIVIICGGCLKWILQEKIRLQIFFFMFVHELKRQKEKKSNDQQKWMGKSDISVMTADHSVIKVWKCHQRSAAYQLLEHHGSVICCNICVRPKELHSKGCSECNLKRDV